MVVEDDALVRFAIAEELRDQGVHVVEATNADEAWSYLTSGSSVALVFTDHRMPGSMTGAQLVAQIARRFPKIGAVLTTGLFDPSVMPGDVILKPYPLAKTSRRLIEHARHCLEEDN